MRKPAVRGTHHHSWVLHGDAGGRGSQGSTNAMVVFKTDFYLRWKVRGRENNLNNETSHVSTEETCHYPLRQSHSWFCEQCLLFQTETTDYTNSCLILYVLLKRLKNSSNISEKWCTKPIYPYNVEIKIRLATFIKLLHNLPDSVRPHVHAIIYL